MAAHDADAALLQPRQHRGVVEVVDDLVAPAQHGLDIQRAGRRLARTWHAPRLLEDLPGPQQRLRRHARVEGALTSDEMALHQRDLQPALADTTRAHLTGRPGADDDDVDLVHRPDPTQGLPLQPWT